MNEKRSKKTILGSVSIRISQDRLGLLFTLQTVRLAESRLLYAPLGTYMEACDTATCTEVAAEGHVNMLMLSDLSWASMVPARILNIKF